MAKELKLYSLQEYVDAGKAETGTFLIEELLPESRLGMLVGPAKSNKTTIAYMIGKAIADESITECLGHKVLEHGNVLYIALEGGLGPQINAFGICNNFVVADDKYFLIDKPDNFKIIEDIIANNNVKLLIIDALYKALSGNIANADEVRPILVKLEDLTRKHKVTVLMLHHTGRVSNKSMEQDMNDVSGSFNIVRSSEFTMLLGSESKSEEEEVAEANMSSDEYAQLPRKRILKKKDYRDGGEGYDKYSVDIYFGTGNQDGYIDAYKYKTTSKRAKPKVRLEDLINCSRTILAEIQTFTKQELAELIHARYKDLAVSSLTRNYIPDIVDALLDMEAICKEGKRYISKLYVPF